MKWFMNLSIEAKLRSTFALVAFLILSIGLLGYLGISTGMKSNSEIFIDQYLAVARLSEIQSVLLGMRGDAQSMIRQASVTDRTRIIRGMEDDIRTIEKNLMLFDQTETSHSLTQAHEKFLASWPALKKEITAISDLALKGRDREATAILTGDTYPHLEQCRNDLSDLIGNAGRTAETAQNENRARMTLILVCLVFLVVIGLVLSLFIGTVLAKSIRDKIGNLVTAAEALASGDVDTRVEVTTTNELGRLAGSFNTLAEQMKHQAAEADQIARGNLGITVRQRSDKDIQSQSRNRVVQILRALLDETNSMLRSANAGELNVRAESGKFSGGYRDIVEGMNRTLDAVVTPIRESSEVLSVMATGDLTHRVSGDYKGDHQIMKNSVNELAESLSATVRDVSEVITATASSSTEISSSIEEMASGAQSQSLQTAEIAGAIEEMTSTILENSKNASHALNTAKKASQVAEDGGRVVRETVQYMNRIADVVKKSAGTVQALGKSGTQIGEIIQVIDDIADQTNLLALNAAIEAARAGDQGRGFAVVADEVRKLAERTTKATKEIAQMIKRIQGDTSGAVKAMEEGTHEVDKGIELAQKAGLSLDEIVKVVAQLTDMATQIAAGSEQQSSAAEQISKNIESISSVTHEYAGGIQEMARATSDLNKLTEQLQHLITQFRIDGGLPKSQQVKPEQQQQHKHELKKTV